VTPTKRTTGRRWVAIRARVLSANPLCAHCKRAGIVRAATEVDHVVPLTKGGTDQHDNLQALCSECHSAKSVTERGYIYRAGSAADGTPLDPAHHWNQPGS